MAKILLVEYEHELEQLMSGWLWQHGHHLVETLENGSDANMAIQMNKYDIIILDTENSNLEICRQFRKARRMTPILLVSAKNSVEDVESGLDAGADDYLSKPFAMKELAARVRALLRRGHSLYNNQLCMIDVIIDPSGYTVTRAGDPIHLLPQEFKLLEFLARHPDRIFSDEELLAAVWESDAPITLDTVRGHIRRIRKKLDNPDQQSIISNIYGVGYMLDSRIDMVHNSQELLDIN